MKGAGVEPRPLAPLAGMITTTLPLLFHNS